MPKTTVADLEARLDAMQVAQDKVLFDLTSQVSTLALALQVMQSPLNKTVAAPTGEVKPPKAQRADGTRPTCVNFRKCGVRSETNLPIKQHHPDSPGAIGWKCGGDLAGCK